MSDDIANRLFESGCDDSVPAVIHGVPAVSFHREANSLAEAVATGIRDIDASGLVAKQVQLDDDTEAFDAISSVIETTNAMLSYRVGP